ncbi:hypothetical protein [Planctobacterium marinum]|uniref:Uncharacterized protein n=1 Tax=Planctobacterium marinum TaxID=1631968 RepID=A0AA48KR48_9ALTE|nr:hypothetical protein MACH26_05950 [Planctobacterium marinum]
MKTISNKTAIAITALFNLAFSNLSLAEVNHNADLYVTSGYPYENLVERYDSVRIRYVEYTARNEIQCKVELDLGGHISTTPAITTEQKEFMAAPLKACLRRADARQALSTTFE